MLTYIIIGVVVVALALGGAGAAVALTVVKKKSAPKAAPAEEKAEAPAEVPAEKTAEEVPEKVSEEVAEEVNEVEALPDEAPAEEESGDEDEDSGEEVEEEDRQLAMVEENGKIRYIIIKYSKSFQAKLIQSDAETKNYYSRIKNELLSYGGVKSRMSWKWEAFRSGRKTLAKLRLRGKTLSVALALDPTEFEDSKYIVDSLAEVKSYADTPCLYRLKNDRRLRYSAELIERVMAENGLSKGLAAEECDYAGQFPFETTEALIERKLIKVLSDGEAQSGTRFMPAEMRRSVTVQEADSLMDDEIAELLIQQSGGVSDRTKTGIINIDTLSKYFADGETVTLEEIKKRVPDFSGKVTYLKVLARGTLDKKLTVKADSFSLQAIKMIVLTGGNAVRV